jgi:hypothetical protein
MKAVEEKTLVYPYQCTGCRSSDVAVNGDRAACNRCGWKMRVENGQLVDFLPGWIDAGKRRCRQRKRRRVKR